MNTQQLLNKNWRLTDYRVGDEEKILKLFKIVFQRELSVEYWKWRFWDNPDGAAVIKLLFDKDNLIGHYAVIPRKVKVGDSVHPCVFSMTTMTHPEYRKMGIFNLLAQEVYDTCRKQGYYFVYGFPNVNSYQIFMNQLGWQEVVTLTRLYKSVAGHCIEIENRSNLFEIKRFDTEIDILWDKVRNNFNVIVPRTKEYLNWRFTDNPSVEYKVCFFKDKGTVRGYIVLKIYDSGTSKIGHIIDLISESNEKITLDLLAFAYDYFLKNNVLDIFCWSPPESRYDSLLKGEGFAIVEEKTWFGYRFLSKNEQPINRKDWYLTMGDSDVF